MKLPIKSIAAFAASPQGRRTLRRMRDRIDTPENRERLDELVARARATVNERSRGSARKPGRDRS